MKSVAPKLTLAILAAIAVVCLLPARDAQAHAVIARPELHWATEGERHESLDAMRRAWLARDHTSTVENGVEERRFIFRMNFFTRYVRDTETFSEATSFLVSAYYENAAVYGEINPH